MKLEQIAAIVRDDMTTLQAIHGSSGPYTYKVLQSLADTLSAGDKVLVRNAQGVRWAEVLCVDPKPQIDLDSDIHYQWAFQKVDLDELERLETEDAYLLRELEQRRFDSVREQALMQLGITRLEASRLFSASQEHNRRSEETSDADTTSAQERDQRSGA